MESESEDLTKRLEETERLLSQETEKRRAAEGALQESRETFKLALKEMPVLIFAADDDGALVFFNREFEEVSGYNAQDLATDPEMMQFLFQLDKDNMASAQQADGEWHFRSKDGSEKVVYWSHLSEYPPLPGWTSWKVGVDITELKAARARVKVLSGLLPICSNCKKIRDDTGYWNRIEAYIHDHSEADFTHGICPACARELYPELYEDNE